MTPLALLALTLTLLPPAAVQEAEPPEPFGGMQWRCIGPFRGGRVTAVCGVEGEPGLYYMGAAGGGVWRTKDAGGHWENLTDGQLAVGTVGAVTVAPSDANVIYVGTGEGPIRAVTTASGDGLYRSTDGGGTWKRLGLEASRHIPAVRVHPDDPDTVYVAAQGSSWTPTPERGVYKSTDGGETFARVLHVDETTGACDLALDPSNPRVLYAAMWDHRRTPWQVRSGGGGSGVYKSTDSGATWERLTAGLPEAMGKIGVAVSPADSRRVWAVVEAEGEEGGLYRSDDAGETWQQVCARRVLIARAWYYMHVVADPCDRDTVYVLNSPMMKSIDGGVTFTQVKTPHVDNHALWIDPADCERMVNGNDGGANVSFDGGASWSTQMNQPTAQFYRAICDDASPYWVYGGQQDNSTVGIASETFDGGIGAGDWMSVGGGESAHVAFDPADPREIYATTILGWITAFDRRTRATRNIQAYPQFGLGTDAKDYRYRFNWNAPVLVSRHDPRVLYHAAHVLLRSTDRGLSWTEASGDLTRNEPEKHGLGGVPFTNEAAGAEVYNTIFYVAESAHDPEVLWTGSDCGLVHVTRDGGGTWLNVTPGGLGETQINCIETSPHDPGTAYVVATAYKLGDDRPRILKTEDYGASWSELAQGLPQDVFARVVREDTRREDLLYAGTERGVHLSFDGGATWQPLQLNLPAVPITDLRVHRGDLVAATQGRAFWILDDLSPIRQWSQADAEVPLLVYQPSPAYAMRGADGFVEKPGKNPPRGAVIDFELRVDPEETPVTLVVSRIVDGELQVVRRFESRKEGEDCYGANLEPHIERKGRYGQLKVRRGMNRFVWDLRHENVPCVPGHVIPSGWSGPRVAPGQYDVRVTAGDTVAGCTLDVRPDPRFALDAQAARDHREAVQDVYARIGEVHRAVNRLRSVRAQAEERVKLAERHASRPEIEAAAEDLAAAIEGFEHLAIQSKRETQQDVANFKNLLSMELLYLLEVLDSSGPPLTAGSRERAADLRRAWEDARAVMQSVLGEELPRFNQLLERNGLPPVYAPEAARRPR